MSSKTKMRTVVISRAAAAAATAATLATPAYANEARVDVHGGQVWAGGDSEGTAGVAAGYDWDFGSSAFAGIEGSADKVLGDGWDVCFAVSRRVGAKVAGDKGSAARSTARPSTVTTSSTTFRFGTPP